MYSLSRNGSCNITYYISYGIFHSYIMNSCLTEKSDITQIKLHLIK